jgi:hypothetical protein
MYGLMAKVCPQAITGEICPFAEVKICVRKKASMKQASLKGAEQAEAVWLRLGFGFEEPAPFRLGPVHTTKLLPENLEIWAHFFGPGPIKPGFPLQFLGTASGPCGISASIPCAAPKIG